MPRADLFISADVECDGPIPGPAHFSMLSFGLAVAGTFDGASFEPAALAVSGLDRDRLIREGLAPAEAMTAAAWVREVAGERRPVMVALPGRQDPLPGRPHTHNALDDALEQAELFANIWAWPGTR